MLGRTTSGLGDIGYEEGGHPTDGHGRTVDFRDTVIVMTSSLGSHEIQRLSADISPAVPTGRFSGR